MTDAIVLHSAQGKVTIPRANVYFAFASQRFAYDCVTCGAKCCQGYGYHFDGHRELDIQLAARPSLRFFVEDTSESARGVYMVANCPPACFFLDESKRCSIHATAGRAAKPETCRFFPFNSFRRLGSHLIVAPHPGLCPLHVCPKGQEHTLSDHEDLLADFGEFGIAGEVAETGQTCGDPHSALAVEREVRDISEVYLSEPDYPAFTDAQLRLTHGSGTQHGPLAVRHPITMAGPYEQLIDRVLGVDDHVAARQPDDLARVLIASTPFLRSLLLFPGSNTENPLPTVSAARVPYTLLALHSLARHAGEAGMQALTFQSVVRIFQNQQPLLQLLSYLDCAVTWAPDKIIDLPIEGGRRAQRQYIGIAKALLPRRGGAMAPTLAQIIEEEVEGTGLERVMFLKRLARRLAGRVVLRGGAHAPAKGLARPRIFVQRLALNHLGENAISALAHLRTASSPQRG